MSRKMKDSGVAWLRQIPDNWEVVYPKALFGLRKDKAKVGDRQLTASQQYGVIYQEDYMELTGSRVVVVEKDFDILKHVEKGDFVISMRSFQGGLEYSENTGSISSAYVMLIPNLNYVVPEYYKWALKSPTYITALQSTSNLVREGQAMRYTNFVQVPLCIIPKDEQERIADKLNGECKKIDTLISNQQTQIEKLKQYKQSLITEVVTKGLNPDAEMKENEFGEVQPCWWSYTRLKFATKINETTLIPVDIEEISYSPMECVRSDSFQPKTINIKKLPTGLSSFKEGDVLLAKITPCFENGNVAIAKDLKNGYGVGSSELIPFEPIKIVDRFLMYLFQSNRFVETGKSTIRGIGGLRRITMDFIYGYSFYAPDIDEQKQIVAYLDKKCLKIEELISVKQQKIEKLNQYKKSVIYEYVTGKKEV